MSFDDVKVSTASTKVSDLATSSTVRKSAADSLVATEKTDAVNAGLVSGVGDGALRGADKLKSGVSHQIESIMVGSMQDDTDAGGAASSASARTVSSVMRARRSIAAANKQAARAAQRASANEALNVSAKANGSAKGVIVASSALDALADELDNSEELSGVGSTNRSAKSARAAFKRLQEKKGKAAGVEAQKKALQTKAAQTKSRAIAKASSGQRTRVSAEIVRKRVLAQGGKSAATALAPGAAIVFGVILGVVIAFLIFQAILAAISGSDEDVTLEGLPEGISYEMVLAAVECQEKYGHPAGATLTQIVVESTGSHNGLSALAAPPHNNLFGIKWWSGYSDSSEYVKGYDLWETQEASAAGDYYTVKAPFCNFASARDCIYYRSAVFLQGSRYANNPLIKAAIKEKSSDRMFEGLKDAGYATSPTYVETLKAICKEYDFYRFDGITVSDLKKMAQGAGSGQEYDASSSEQKAIVNACRITPFAGQGLCATWVSRVYSGAGWNYPYGNACDMYWNFCNSSNRSELEVGMMIAVPHSPYGSIGWTYGHVGIYIGDNKVMHNASSIQITDLDAWINEYHCSSEPVKWGYPPK